MTESHPLVVLARKTIEHWVQDGEQIDPPENLPPEMQRQAGAFVTLRRGGRLRGCVGTIAPACETLAHEVIRNAISAASYDTRFDQLHHEELEGLEVKVDVLSEPEPVTSLDELDPKRYGLIVQSKLDPSKRGLLLPDLEGIDTVEQQVYSTRRYKALITDPNEPVQMFRFEVKRYS